MQSSILETRKGKNSMGEVIKDSVFDMHSLDPLAGRHRDGL